MALVDECDVLAANAPTVQETKAAIESKPAKNFMSAYLFMLTRALI